MVSRYGKKLSCRSAMHFFKLYVVKGPSNLDHAGYTFIHVIANMLILTDATKSAAWRSSNFPRMNEKDLYAFHYEFFSIR